MMGTIDDIFNHLKPDLQHTFLIPLTPYWFSCQNFLTIKNSGIVK